MRHARLWTAVMFLVALAGCAPQREKPATSGDAQPSTAPSAKQAAATTAATQPAQAAETQPVKAAETQPAEAAGALPIPALGYNAREGAAVYRHYCSTCHGEEGHGDGFNAYNLDPKPRDLADAAFQAKRSDEDLVAVIRSGGGAAGLSTGMPPWGRTLNERKVRNVVDFLRTLPQQSP